MFISIMFVTMHVVKGQKTICWLRAYLTGKLMEMQDQMK